jgi:hypothetical protein
MFIELHGDLNIAQILKSHAREFRDHLQQVPRIRLGRLLTASLPELSDWGRAHPSARKVGPATINKQLGAVQAIANWGYQNGFVPDDVRWSDPFHKMRVEEDPSEREPFAITDLQAILTHRSSPIMSYPRRLRGPLALGSRWLRCSAERDRQRLLD